MPRLTSLSYPGPQPILTSTFASTSSTPATSLNDPQTTLQTRQKNTIMRLNELIAKIHNLITTDTEVLTFFRSHKAELVGVLSNMQAQQQATQQVSSLSVSSVSTDMAPQVVVQGSLDTAAQGSQQGSLHVTEQLSPQSSANSIEIASQKIESAVSTLEMYLEELRVEMGVCKVLRGRLLLEMGIGGRTILKSE
ncbi:MAG: hypothetical protein M1835_004027 [Candelina submexicana]|nr:MAG: hypothetical protein M1835_004027 [Candelina submexicana]